MEEANIKLGSVLSDVFGVSGQLMLEKLLEGEPDLAAIANLAQRKARAKIAEIRRSLQGHRLRDHHRRMLRLSLEHLEFLENQIDAIDGAVLELIERHGYRKPFELVQSLPGIGEISAAALLAKTGPDMSVFPVASQLSSWIGVCPGNRISAGKNRSTAIPRGNRWARTALVECAWAAAAKKDCYLRERFQRLCAKKGRKQASTHRRGPRAGGNDSSYAQHRPTVAGTESAPGRRTQTATIDPAPRAAPGQARSGGSFAPS
jgi:transposase